MYSKYYKVDVLYSNQVVRGLGTHELRWEYEEFLYFVV